MQKRNAAIAFAALALLVLAGAEATNAANQERGDRGDREPRGPSEEVRNAFESGDYDTWKELVSQRENSPVAEFTEDQFNRLQEAHELRESGDKEGAKAIREELGLKKHPGKRGNHKGKRLHKSPEAREAIEAGDYEAFREALSGHEKALDNLTQEKFEEIVERFNNRPQNRQAPQQPQA